MKHYTKTEIKRTAQVAISNFTGMEPKLSDITLLESSDDRTYILFRVRDIEYRFTSYVFDTWTNDKGEQIQSIWAGDGTIERLGRRTRNGNLIP